jgi:hypothetical protein
MSVVVAFSPSKVKVEYGSLTPLNVFISFKDDKDYYLSAKIKHLRQLTTWSLHEHKHEQSAKKADVTWQKS